MQSEYRIADWNGLKLAWTPELDGGGRLLRHDFDPVVARLFGRVGRLFEFCAGPGYIGFSLLSQGLCDHLVLADVNPHAIDAVNETVRLNGLEDRVTVYRSDGLNDIPAHEQWDLVVSNPPHFAEQTTAHPSLILDDPGWRLHREFYARIGDFLAPGGSVLMEENSQGSMPDEFLPMIADGGLTFVRNIWYTDAFSAPYFYFVWATKGPADTALAERPEPVSVALRDSPNGSVPAPAGHPSAIRLLNETGRAVRPQLVDDSGNDQAGIPLEELAPGAEVALPLLGLRAGEYEVRDTATGAVVARLTAG